ncbi:pyrimidine-specific ribonucleoside hydrolase RihA-like isoform X2 [Portunus trituberculatus]|uniref:pyrimidine-specific ribonucleoside hydrolase RihA-like isoform X2 n=1 Tax=Portunus trituberculatus TaxID=210409 RepID=UPI001E1CFCA2|nr:pyrimidine-specific ribonucleoside hydrolase RihA-like isoform X2 [Portunus trituberculatus]
MLVWASHLARHTQVVAGLQRGSQYSIASLCGRLSLMKQLRMAATKVIIDTDPGTDDALAIFMALEAHRRGCLKVLAITTVQGNASLHNVNNNIFRILRLANMLEVPVYSGASQSLVHPYIHGDEPFHGKDGFGEAVLPPQPPASTFLQSCSATLALLDLVKQHSGEVVLVGLGPLTNVALALHLDPAFTSHLAAFYVMGGNTSGKGNVTSSAEFNFHCDPDAAFVVLSKTSIPIHLNTWDSSLNCGSIPYSVRDELGQTKTAVADLMNKIEAQQRVKRKNASKPWVTCDQLTMAWVIDDAKEKKLKSECSGENDLKLMGFLAQKMEPMVTATRTCYATVETTHGLTSGQMVVDNDNLLGKQPNVILLEDINDDIYVKYLSMAFGADV